ncbi:DUF4040 domain-containing protein [Pleurocapsa sp. PCC 7319]|uniref:DUF4040 domain-containing protein n=1 Tax=Pleurocapsa sp. PCC 7319 TaxID=118161 RepID=UPI000349214F|nr:DUF4040 domain-containing protein [Pleurocapsa sp. PCC 7319]
MIDNYVYVIVALLPLAALMLLFQVNPYHALVIRAILGAVAALVYAVLGASDVALTEALVGTMLVVTLYVIAVRSSLVMRLGILKDLTIEKESYFAEIITNLRKVVNKYHLRLELVEYPNSQALEKALMTKEVHATCNKRQQVKPDDEQIYDTAIRVRRLFEILQTELTFPETTLTYVTVSNVEDKH